jgi:hypothetical protein
VPKINPIILWFKENLKKKTTPNPSFTKGGGTARKALKPDFLF